MATARSPDASSGSEADYGAVHLPDALCIEIGSDLVACQNRCVDVQGYERTPLLDNTLGGRLLVYLRGQGASVPALSACRVPTGRAAVLAQLQDEFPDWYRLYSTQPPDTPLPGSVTQQLDFAAEQVQAAYLAYVARARTLRSSRRGQADSRAAGGPRGGRRTQRSYSTPSRAGGCSPSPSLGGASAGTAAMSISSGGAPRAQRGRSGRRRGSQHRHRHRHGAAAAGGDS